MDILFFDRRPVLPMALTAITGIYAATGDSPLWSLIFCTLILAGAFLAGTSWKYIVYSVIAGVLFLGWGALNESSLDRAYLCYDNQKTCISGTVTSVDFVCAEYTSVTVRPDGLNKPKIKVYLMDCRSEILEGNRLEASGIIHKPKGRTNPGGYDKRKALYSERTAAFMYSGPESTYIKRGSLIDSIAGLIRKDIRSVCMELLGDGRGAVLAGMMTGDRRGLSEDDSEAFRESGLSHTMAVSGSHVAYILIPVMFICRRAGIVRRKYYPWLLVLLLAFAALTGFTPSVCRASLTAGMMILAGLLKRETDAMNSLAVTALVIVFINPYSVYDAGFILSYTSVLSILIFYRPIIKITGKNPVMQAIAISLAVQPGVVIATMKIFHTIQLFSVVSNVLIFPVRALAALLGWVLYLISGLSMSVAAVPAFAEGVIVDMITEVARLYGNSVWSTVNVQYVHPLVAAVIPVTAYLALKMKKNAIIVLTAGISIVALYFLAFANARDTYVFYDVGQADCILVKTDRGNDILIDTGSYSPGSSLAYYTGDYIDFIFLTHAHDDHIGGLTDILDRYRVGMVFIPGCHDNMMDDVIRTCKSHGTIVRGLSEGNELMVDGYRIEVMNPGDGHYLSLNDTSLVLKLTHGGTKLLFTGDIEAMAEAGILACGHDIEANILKVPHHGAAGSAYKAFYDAVSPELAVVSCGLNCYGHPSSKALDLLGECTVYRTDHDGAVIIMARKAGYGVTAYGR